MIAKLKAYALAIRLAVRSVRRNGLNKTADSLEAICHQSDFWFLECERLHKLAMSAYDAGDIESYNAIAQRHRLAIKRFKSEVCEPMDELTGLRNSIVEL